MGIFEVISTVSHKSLMNKTKHDLATWIMHLLNCRDESERARVQRVTDLLEANNRYQQDAREARAAYRRLIAADKNDDEALPRYTTRRLRQEIERQTSELRAERDAALCPPLKTLDEWHEDIGDVVWWTLDERGQWLGEPAYIGTPLDLGRTILVTVDGNEMTTNVGGWPNYHTHWTPHPPFPSIPRGKEVVQP